MYNLNIDCVSYGYIIETLVIVFLGIIVASSNTKEYPTSRIIFNSMRDITKSNFLFTQTPQDFILKSTSYDSLLTNIFSGLTMHVYSPSDA